FTKTELSIRRRRAPFGDVSRNRFSRPLHLIRQERFLFANAIRHLVDPQREDVRLLPHPQLAKILHAPNLHRRRRRSSTTSAHEQSFSRVPALAIAHGYKRATRSVTTARLFLRSSQLTARADDSQPPNPALPAERLRPSAAGSCRRRVPMASGKKSPQM